MGDTCERVGCTNKMGGARITLGVGPHARRALICPQHAAEMSALPQFAAFEVQLRHARLEADMAAHRAAGGWANDKQWNDVKATARAALENLIALENEITAAAEAWLRRPEDEGERAAALRELSENLKAFPAHELAGVEGPGLGGDVGEALALLAKIYGRTNGFEERARKALAVTRLAAEAIRASSLVERGDFGTVVELPFPIVAQLIAALDNPSLSLPEAPKPEGGGA